MSDAAGPPGATAPDVLDGIAWNTLVNIHAVARHLLGIEPGARDAEDLFVGVQPLGNGWRVQVAYASFELRVKRDTLVGALQEVLSKLVSQVGRRLDDGTRLLAALSPEKEKSNKASRKGIEEAVLTVPLVAYVDVIEGCEPGVVHVNVWSHGAPAIQERDEMCVQIGAALERIRAISIRFEVKVLGFITQ